MAYGDPAIEDENKPDIAYSMSTGGMNYVGISDRIAMDSATSGMSAQQAAIMQQELDQVNAAIMAGDYERVKDMRFTEISTANLAHKMADDAKSTAEFQQNALGGIAAATGLGIFGLGDNSKAQDKVGALEDLNAIGTGMAVGGGTSTAAMFGLTQGQLAIMPPGARAAEMSLASLGDLSPGAGTPQAGIDLALAAKAQKDTGEYRRPGASTR